MPSPSDKLNETVNKLAIEHNMTAENAMCARFEALGYQKALEDIYKHLGFHVIDELTLDEVTQTIDDEQDAAVRKAEKAQKAEWMDNLRLWISDNED